MIKQKVMLDVGCGFNKQKGFVGIDKREIPGIVDIVHNVEVFPWPIKDEECALVFMSHLVEHIAPQLQIDLMNECWRILEVDGVLAITTPYGGSFGWFQDPTHIASWNEATPTYFVPGEPLYNVYKPKPWKIDKLYWNTKFNIECVFRKIADD